MTEEYAGAEGFDGGVPEEQMAGEGAGEPEDELEAMKRKLAEMEAEANRLRELQSKGSADMEMVEGGDAAKEEVDARSIFIGQVDYGTTPEELQQLFANCGTVNRVTILTDKFGNPKGFAYLEFLEKDAVDNAILLDNTELRGRNLKVTPKRTNTPGLKRGRGRGRGRGGFHGGYGYGGYGYAPRGRGFRGRGRGRFSPY